MPVKENKPAAAEPEANVENDRDDPLNAPGFHVLGNGNYCGTFVDHEQAQLYVDGQLKPQEGMSAEIVEGPAAVE